MSKKINIIAIGGVSKILSNLPKNQNLFAIDTNSKNLQKLAENITKIQFGSGDGSGGDSEFAKTLFDEKQIESIFDCDLLVLIAGIGGGTGSGITPLIAKIAKEKKILTKLICFTPLQTETSYKKSDEVLSEFKNLKLPITLINNQQIFDKMHKETQIKEFWGIANFQASETIKALKNILESENIDYLDLKNSLDFEGLCYSNVAKGENFDKALEVLDKTTNPNIDFKTARGFLLSFKIGNSGMTVDQNTQIQKFIKNVQNGTQADLKTSQEYTEKDEFEITVLVSGIGSKIQIDENYQKTILEKQTQSEKDKKSEIAKQNASKK